MLGWDILGALNELPLRCEVGATRASPCQAVQCWEGWRRGAALQGDAALFPFSCLPGWQQPCSLSNMQFAPQA